MTNKGFPVCFLSVLKSFSAPETKRLQLFSDNEAIIDSGCTTSILKSREYLVNTCKPDEILEISQANGDLIQVVLQGILNLAKDMKLLENISVMPDCTLNLLSVSQMCETWNALIIFNKDGVKVTRKKIPLSEAETILSGSQRNGLYHLPLPNMNHIYCTQKVIKEADADEYIAPDETGPKKRVHRTLNPEREKELKLWHQRHGHLSGLCRTIGAKAIHGLPPNYKDLIADPDQVCNACIFAKNKMRPHHSGCCTFQCCGEMLHIDLHEKSTLSYHNNKYSILIIEDYSGCDLSQFIKRKSDAGNKIIDVIQKLERQAGVKVKILQCDGASEFIGQETSLSIYYHKKGIEIRCSSPCCLQENGVAERGNYT